MNRTKTARLANNLAVDKTETDSFIV